MGVSGRHVVIGTALCGSVGVDTTEKGPTMRNRYVVREISIHFDESKGCDVPLFRYIGSCRSLKAAVLVASTASLFEPTGFIDIWDELRGYSIDPNNWKV